MRRAVSFFLMLLLVPFMVYSTVTYADGAGPVPELEEMIASITASRRDVDVEVTDFGKREGLLELSITAGDEDMSFVAEDGRMLRKMLEDAFFALPAFAEDSLSVESVYGNLVSANGSLRRGSLYYATDADGRRMALLRAEEDLPEGRTLLNPIMQRDLYPGYALEKGPSVALDFSFASTLASPVFDASLSVRMVSLLEFLDPVFSVNYIYDRGASIIQAGIGFETHATLSKVTSSSFTLLEDGEIFASVEALFGYGRGGFLPGVTYTVGYGHHFLPNAYWRIGYSANPETGSEMRLSGGVLL